MRCALHAWACCFPTASQCFMPSHHRWFSLPTSSQRDPGISDRQTDYWGRLSVRPSLCLFVAAKAETWRLSDWRAYENVCPRPRTNLYLNTVTLVTDQSNTPGVKSSPNPPCPPSKKKFWLDELTWWTFWAMFCFLSSALSCGGALRWLGFQDVFVLFEVISNLCLNEMIRILWMCNVTFEAVSILWPLLLQTYVFKTFVTLVLQKVVRVTLYSIANSKWLWTMCLKPV